jgi:plasmid replication initiation protein
VDKLVFLAGDMASNSLITKGNDLIQASYTLSLSETRVILLCLSKIDSRKALPTNLEFMISAADFHDELGVGKTNAYRDLMLAVDKLYDRSILIDVNNPSSRMRWIYRKAYDDDKAQVLLSFAPELTPFISELSSRFTSYKLKDVAKFRSSYAIRIYELLVQFKDNRERRMAVGDLRAILELTDKYASIKDFKKYVINPALEDINEHSNISASLDQEKIGREVTHLIFRYTIKGVKDTKPKITKAYIEKHAFPGETYESAGARLRKS